MAIKQVYESDYAVYPGRDTTVAPGEGYFTLRGVVSDYDWQFNALMGLSLERPVGAGSKTLIRVWAVINMARWPGWETATFTFDGESGAFIGSDLGYSEGLATGSPDIPYTLRSVWVARDRTLWATSIYYDIWRWNGARWENLYPNHYWGANEDKFMAVFSPFAVDQGNDVAIVRLSGNPLYRLTVCQLSTGDTIRDIDVAGEISQVFLGDEKRAWAVSKDGVLTSFNYLTGETLGVLGTGIPSAVGGQEYYPEGRWTWDPWYRRLLFVQGTPDEAVTGASRIRVTGYYPVSIPYGLTAPIPLKTPAVGLQVPVWCKVYGEAGEGVVGEEVAFTLDTGTPAELTPAKRATSARGEVRATLQGVVTGSDDMTATVEY